MTPMLEKLCPIMPCRDIAATREFWSALGFVRTSYDDPPEYLIMERDGAEVHFFLSPGHDPLKDAPSAYLRLSDVDALDAEWAALGLPPEGIPRLMRAEDKPWGMRELALIDPDGNLIRAGQELPLG
jgi:catechol 2,3-dioxygenase-like lactoylglutathione lyase family enzyme